MAESSRIAVLESRLQRVEEDRMKLEGRVQALEERTGGIETKVAVLATRVGIYAAGGALIGGGLISLLVNAVSAYFSIKGGP